MTVKLLRWFAEAWVLAFLALLLLSAGRQVFFVAPSVGQGLSDVQSWFDPYSVWTYVTPLVAVSPAIAAFYMAHRVSRR
ncbi:MAG: hypothetical protein JSW71_12005 [Gemmatimonadota bacterium]|nr:MAG: hypothetical protein JSW71_12005 [Gemmatimonadota bacterium]